MVAAAVSSSIWRSSWRTGWGGGRAGAGATAHPRALAAAAAGRARNHVDADRLALRPVECLAPGTVHERQEVAGRLDRGGIPAGRGRRRPEAVEGPLQRRGG